MENKATWYLHFAPQFHDIIARQLGPFFINLKKVEKCNDLYVCEGNEESLKDTSLKSNLNPRVLSPFVRSQWKCDHLWPGALKHADFINRTSQWVVQELSNHDLHDFAIETAFEDRTNLKSKLADHIKATQGNTPKVRTQGAQTLFILITPQALVSCKQSYSEHGLIRSLPKELQNKVGKESKQRGGTASQLEGLSRAGKKIEEAIAHAKRAQFFLSELGLLQFADLGASPGGISFRLSGLVSKVIAIDRAPLHESLSKVKNIHFLKNDVADVQLETSSLDGIVCDMNGDCLASAKLVCRFASSLKAGGQVFFTLKISQLAQWQEDFKAVKSAFLASRFEFFDCVHLFHNRNELTLFFKKL